MESANLRRLQGLLGLAIRKRGVAFGRMACRRAAERGKLYLVLVATDAGESALRDSALPSSVRILDAQFDKAELGKLVGRAELALLGITDPHLSAGLLECARTDGT